jgi:peptidylprolyl isomerase
VRVISASSGLILAGLVLSSCSPTVAFEGQTLVDGCATDGENVLSIEVSGGFDSEPVVEMKPPLRPRDTERLVLVEGDGEAIGQEDRAVVAFAIFNGSSGEVIGYQGFDDGLLATFDVVVGGDGVEGIAYTLLCSTVGSRVVGVFPAAQAFGEAGFPEFGLGPMDSVVFVADVHGIEPPPPPPLARLSGEVKDAPDGFPEVSYKPSGEPTAIFEPSSEPRDFQMARLIDGEGPEVFPGAVVVVHYSGFNLSNGDNFDSSWKRGEPNSFPTSNLVMGFRDALVGQRVGSRMFVIIPPALGYGPAGTVDGRIGPNDNMFFVIDILGIR